MWKAAVLDRKTGERTPKHASGPIFYFKHDAKAHIPPQPEK